MEFNYLCRKYLTEAGWGMGEREVVDISSKSPTFFPENSSI